MSRIQLSKPSITDEEVHAVEQTLRSRWLVYGPENRAFEEELASFCGKRFAATLSSGTAALHLALLSLPQRPTRILVPSFTFPATANVAQFLPSPPEVYVADVDERTFCLPEQTVSAWLAQHESPALLVHQFGHPSPIPSAQHALIVSDAACAIGVRPALAGSLACLSFHPRKLLTTGEGGAILTDDATLIDAIRQLRAHGLRAVPGEEVMELPDAGLNYRLPEVGAAMGRVQLRRLPALIRRHRELAEQYLHRLKDLPLGFQADHPERIWQTFSVVLPQGIRRKAVRELLSSEGIETQIASYGLHRLTAYQHAPRFLSQGPQHELPVCDRLHSQGMALPLHSELSDRDVDRVCDALQRALIQPAVRQP